MAEKMLDDKTKNKLNDLTNNTLEEDQKLEEDLDFFHDNNTSQKKEVSSPKKNQRKKLKLYSSSRIK